MHINFVISVILLLYFLIFVPQDLLGFISTGEKIFIISWTVITLELLLLLGFMLLIAGTAAVQTIIIRLNKKIVGKLLSWMAELENRTTYFCNQPYRNTIEKAYHYSMNAMKFATVLITSGGLSVSVLITAFQFFVVGKADYLPIRCYFPFLPPTNLISYLINFIHQTYSVFTVCGYALLFFYFKVSCLIYLLAHLYAIEKLVGHMDKGINAKDFHAWFKLIAREIHAAKM